VSGGVQHLYVHLPFCAHRCGYCDFVTVVGRRGQHGAYVDAVLAELALRLGETAEVRPATPAERAGLEAGDVLAVEQRLNATVDRLVTECVVAYFDRATSELAHEARHDQLTGLLHHQAFVRELELELERSARYGHGLALVFLDLDCFKQINDTLGHPAGDLVLRRLGELLRDSLRGSDLAGRMGGDEFAAYLVEADEEAGSRLLGRLSDRLDELVAAEELPVACTFSAGLAHFPDEAADVDGLFRVADRRLYEAKRSSAD
jgi:diguanylate cyclase (GGDEF)-like protein